MRVGVAGVTALVLMLLGGCTGLGNPDQTKACRALADQVPGISGVKEASFTDAIQNSLPRCAGLVVLDPGLTTTQRGQVVGSLYDVVRTRGVKEVQFNTQFSLGASTFLVSSGFPTAEQATTILGIAETAHADPVEIAYTSTGLLARLHARLTSTTTAGSLREGTALLRVTPPMGIREIDWYLSDTQIVSPTVTTDEATRLEAVASWFEKNPAVASYSYKDESGTQTWALLTTSEVPDVVRDFATLVESSATVRVTGAVTGKAPYVRLP